MTDVFYVAVKGSLHASDSSVFGLTTEEIAALSKRYKDIKKQVINGVLIKASPLQVLNSLSELGYRVACSSGEAELVWTLRREVLGPRKGSFTTPAIDRRDITPERGRTSASNIKEVRKSVDSSGSRRFSKPPEVFGRKPIVKPAPTKEKSEIKIERIGTKPEDIAEYLGYSGSRILVTSPEDVEYVPEGQKIIIKTNENSADNPMVTWNTRDVRRKNVTIDTPPPEVICTDDMSCTRAPPVPSVHQTMEEMDFERGLWYPALTGDLPRIRTLLNKGQNPNEEDKNGYTALHYAARCGFTTICTQLLEAGASINKATRAGGSTPLHRAAFSGNDDTVTVLVKYGGNLLAKDADGRVPLHRAVEANHPTTVALLLEASPESASIKDRTGKTARHYIQPNNKVMGQLFEIFDDADMRTKQAISNNRPSLRKDNVKVKDKPQRMSPQKIRQQLSKETTD